MSEYIMDGNKYVQELVRCKDCKHWQDAEEGIVECPVCTRPESPSDIPKFKFVVGAEGFCSYGERQDNER